jgi:acetate kinase
MPIPKPSALIKPTLDTKFYIDYEWWERSQEDLRHYVLSHLLPEQRERLSQTHEERSVDYMDPETGELVLTDAELHGVRVVGHRVVHGGERYHGAVPIDHDVEATIEELGALAPLHNPANLIGIRAARRLLPEAVHVAVFDTAFHAMLPPEAFLFGLPYELYADSGIRRYGFHGPSHDFVTRRAAEIMGRDRGDLRLVSLHLGNGASAAAVCRGESLDTTMGFTPLDGLLMGTRCGDLDPGVVLHLLRSGRSLDEVDEMLNRESGLRGLSGVSNDMRDVRRAASHGDVRAQRALAVFGYRVRKAIGAFAAAMGGLDGIVFTGGIGENDAATRRESLAGLEWFGVRIDDRANDAGETVVHAADSDVAVLVVGTDEERMIAEQSNAVLAALLSSETDT